MKHSDNIAALAAALSAAQAEIANPAFDAKNPHFGNGYASLAAVRNEVLPKLAKYGLSLLQPLVRGDGAAGCGTIILHKSGEWIELDPIMFPVAKDNAHGVAGALTYARRISLQAAGACVGDDDDDGNAATAAAPKALPRAMSGADVNKEAFDALGDEAQAYIREYANSVIDLFNSSGDVMGYLAKHSLDAEEKMALWSLLPSNIRSSIKKAQAEMRKAA